MDESPGHVLRVFCMFSLRKVRRRTFPLELRISFTESASVFQNGIRWDLYRTALPVICYYRKKESLTLSGRSEE